eukprot:augustus_masked-scaffold_2-processed-gene-2.24-mRNA-1 protein AED:1.00 eAED:1.00 QI:0/-1/0/0/-1/1/1/0/392
MFETVKLVEEKKKANELITRYKLLKGHTAASELLIEAGGIYSEILGNIFKEKGNQSSEAPQKEFISLKISILLNLSFVSLELKSFDSCLNCCNSVLEIDKKNEKALYRKGIALENTNNLKDALSTFELLVSCYPKNKPGVKKLKSIPIKVAQGTENRRLQEMKHKPVRITTAILLKHDLEPFTRNGGFSKDKLLIWSQTIKKIEFIVSLPLAVKRENVSVEYSSKNFHLEVRSEKYERTITRNWYQPINVEEVVWEIERKQDFCYVFVHVEKNEYLNKLEKVAAEWWEYLFESPEPEEKIATERCALKEEEYHELPKEIREKWKENFLRGKKTDTLQSIAMSQISSKEQEMATQDVKERVAKNKRAMQDPGKKALYEMFEESFPNVAVEFGN